MSVLTKIDNESRYQTRQGDNGGPCENTIIVGSKSKFVPNLNLYKWRQFGSESFLNINHKDVNISNQKEVFTNNQVELVVGDVKERLYPLNDNVFEWEIIFAAEPAKHAIEFDLTFSSDLVFRYQDEISDSSAQKWVDDGEAATLLEAKRLIRPANVLGSYAVYSPGKRNNEFKIGKICHLYRWICIDALNNTAWCDLEIDPVSGTWLIKLPSAFMASASYPVLCMGAGDTLGNASEGASEDYWYSSASSTGPFTGAAGTLTDVNVLCNGNGSQEIWVMLMTDSSGVPNQSVGSNSMSEISPPSQTKQWTQTSWSDTITAQDYHFIVSCQAQCDFYYDDVDSYEYDDALGIGDGAWAHTETFSSSGTRTQYISVYANYTAASTDLEIDVYDSPTLNENIGPSAPLAGISKFDSVEVQEVIDALMDLVGGTSYDQINVTEFVDAIIHLVADAGDDVNITELIQSVMSGGYTSVAQDIEVTESVTMHKPVPVSTSQDVGVSEDIESVMSDGVLDTAQDVEVSEDITSVLSDPPAETADDLEVSEDITSVMDAKTEPYQDVTVNEYVEMLLQIAGEANINVNDLINVVENIQSKMSGLITDKHDQVVLTEVIALSLVIEISKFDTVQISEYLLNRMSGLPADLADNLTIQESISVDIPIIPVEPTVDDDIGVSEAITSRMDIPALSLSDIIELVENVEVQLRLKIIEHDSIEIAETILAKMGAAILSAYEQVNISEYSYGRMADAALSPFQSVAISEAVSLSVSVPVYLTSIGFALAQRGAAFSLTKRNISFELN